MANNLPGGEYDFSESSDSPLRKYRPLRPLVLNKSLDNHNDSKLIGAGLDNDVAGAFIRKSCSSNTQVTISNNSDLASNFQHAKEPRKSSNSSSEKFDSAPRSFALRTQRRVTYIWSEELIQRCDSMLKIPMRASLVSSLIEAYGLDKLMRVEKPSPATFEELLSFHSSDYLEFLQKISCQEDEDKYDEESVSYGLSYDCPAHKGVYEYTSLVCGSTLRAAECLKEDLCDVAINWNGGWHHGKKDSASGFCYTNDIVLGILSLKQKFSRVLYVDLDLHHGDGVEDAFSATNKVMTVSVHKYIAGFFPGTGSVSDVGYGKGKYYSVNIPLKDGIRDQEFSTLVCRVLIKVKEKFNPEVVVCQCGADGLVGDPMKSFNLTPKALGKCVCTLLSWKIPLLLLGGGGYHHANTARCWTYLTGVVLGRTLSSDIPDHRFLMEYGPDFTREITAGNMRDENTTEYMQSVYTNILYNLSHLDS